MRLWQQRLELPQTRSRFYRNGADIAEATKETIAIVHRDVNKGDLSC